MKINRLPFGRRWFHQKNENFRRENALKIFHSQWKFSIIHIMIMTYVYTIFMKFLIFLRPFIMQLLYFKYAHFTILLCWIWKADFHQSDASCAPFIFYITLKSCSLAFINSLYDKIWCDIIYRYYFVTATAVDFDNMIRLVNKNFLIVLIKIIIWFFDLTWI